MANDINNVNIIGRLTRDPELKQTNGGTAFVNFGIAVNKSYTSNGEKKEEVSYFDCIAWGKLAEIINQYCIKGKQVAILGALKQDRWETESGEKRSKVGIVVENLQMIGSKQSEGEE
jgi:single-strand DNA-binding protein